MYDLKLDGTGDLDIGVAGDISLTESVRQALQVRLRWLFGEWRFSPKYGVPYLDEITLKRPDVERIKQVLRNEIMDVEGMSDVKNMSVIISSEYRTATISFDGYADGESFSEEVVVSV